MQNPAITLRPLQAADIKDAMALSGAEGWNQTADDWTFILQHSKGSCAAAVSDGKLVGTATAMGYANRVAWIGMVLVNQLYRGQGISKILLEHIFKQTGSSASLKLDATAAGQQVYEKMGFRTEYRVARMVHVSVNKMSASTENLLVQPIQKKDLPDIIAFDELVFGASRTALITWLVQQFPGKSWVIKQDDQAIAFALGRAGSRFHHIGPVVAQNDTDAVMLVGKALQSVAGDPAIVDVLCDKKAFVETLAGMGFTTQRYFTRMYRQENPFPGASSQQYAICGPEFG